MIYQNHFDEEFLPQTDEKWYKALYYIYVPLFGVFMLFIIGQSLSGIISYPYSSKIFTKSFRKQSTQRIAHEFIKCVERISRLIVDM